MNVPGRKKAVYPTHKAASKQTLGIEVEADRKEVLNHMSGGAPNDRQHKHSTHKLWCTYAFILPSHCYDTESIGSAHVLPVAPMSE